MKYNLRFEKESDGWGGELLDTWPKETVVPRVGDSVFMAKGGWLTVVSVGFSTLYNKKKNKRSVLITVR